MSLQSLIALLLLLVLLVLSAQPVVRAFFVRHSTRFRTRVSPPAAAHTRTTVLHNGEEIPIADPESDPPAPERRSPLTRGPWQLATVAVALLIVLLLGVQLYRGLTLPAADQFVVLIAPFQEQDGSVSQTGRTVANDLAVRMPELSGGRVIVRKLDQPPANADAALALVQSADADAVIWGSVSAGGMADSLSLQPVLLYRPNGAFAPFGWDGYAGRFDMPPAYQLTSAPINGEAVLPSLLGALADYSTGHVDSSFTTLGTLLDNYPALAPSLPRALRGNILWARGEYQEAAGEYQRALNGLAADQQAQAAPLYNNLGAILQDAGDASAQNAFNQATSALGGRDLAALRYNLALQSLRQNQPANAASSLEVARNLVQQNPALPSAPLLLTLAESYRLNSAFDQAQSTLDEASRQIANAANATTPELRTLVSSQLDAEAKEQQALLNLARAGSSRGSLLWELEDTEPLPIDTLTKVEANLEEAVDDTRTLGQYWNRLSTAKDAAGEPIAGQVAINHAQRAQALLRERQRWQAAVMIERGQATGSRSPRGLMAVWSLAAGDRTPIGQARTILQGLVVSQPADVDSLVLLGRSYLLQGDLENAAKQFDLAAKAGPRRPEPVHGQAQIALLRSDRAQAQQLLAQAIAFDPNYFPARQQLAAVSQQDPPDWPTAIEQWQWLALNRPSVENQLALAEALRNSGAAGSAQAEQVLLPLANQNNVGALLALGRLYQANGNAPAARNVLDRAQSLAPRDATVAYQYGQFLEEQQDDAGAEAQYMRALNTSNDISSHLALGRLYAEQGKTAQAGQQYSAALAAGANDPAELKRMGEVLLENREYEAAATAYERGIEKLKDDPELYHGLGQANLYQQKLEVAETAEERALQLSNGTYPEAQVALGDIALQRGQNDAAVAQYNAALKLNPQLTAAYLGLGRAAAALGNWSVAQAHFNAAVASNPNSAEAHLWLGEALVRQPNAPDAINQYTQALALQSDYPPAYFGLAQAQLSIGETDAARQNLASALKLNPTYPEAFLLQGKLNEQQGDDNAAIQSYSQAIKVSTVLAEPHYRRALLYMRRDQLNDAVSDLESAVDIQPNFSEAHYWLGRAYLSQGNPKNASAQLTQAIDQRGGNYADARFYQGLAEEQLGQRNNAVESYQTALNQDVNGMWAGEARTALDRLRQP